MSTRVCTHANTRAWLSWCVWEKASSRYQINQQAGRCKWLAYMEPAAHSQNSHSTMDRWPAGPHQLSHTSLSFYVSPALSVPSLSSLPYSISISLPISPSISGRISHSWTPSLSLSPASVKVNMLRNLQAWCKNFKSAHTWAEFGVTEDKKTEHDSLLEKCELVCLNFHSENIHTRIFWM